MRQGVVRGRDLGSLEPQRVLGMACAFPSLGWASALAVRERKGSSEWLSSLTSPIVEERQEDFQVQNASKL